MLEDAQAGHRLAVLHVGGSRGRMRSQSFFLEIVVSVFANEDAGMMVLVLVILCLRVKNV
jgi:hypothetical protein